MDDVVIVSTARTPIGKAYSGAFNSTSAPTLAGHPIAESIARAGVEPGEVEEVILGCARPEGTQGFNLARVAAIRAGLPASVSGGTVSRQCSSGLYAIAHAAQRIMVDKVPIV